MVGRKGVAQGKNHLAALGEHVFCLAEKLFMALDVEAESWRRGSKFRRSDAREKLPFAFGAEHYVAFLGQRQ